MKWTVNIARKKAWVRHCYNYSFRISYRNDTCTCSYTETKSLIITVMQTTMVQLHTYMCILILIKEIVRSYMSGMHGKFQNIS